MRTPNRRDQQKAETRLRIYDTAMRLFEDHGFDAVPVARIAQEAGVSVPTFYAHYPNKESLLISLPTPEEVHAVLAPDPPELPVTDRVQRAIMRWLGQIGPRSRAELLRHWRLIACTPALRIRTAEFERTTASMVVEVLLADGDLRDRPTADLVVTTLMTAYTQVLLRWADGDGQQELEEVAEQVFGELRRL